MRRINGPQSPGLRELANLSAKRSRCRCHRGLKLPLSFPRCLPQNMRPAIEHRRSLITPTINQPCDIVPPPQQIHFLFFVTYLRAAVFFFFLKKKGKKKKIWKEEKKKKKNRSYNSTCRTRRINTTKPSLSTTKILAVTKPSPKNAYFRSSHLADCSHVSWQTLCVQFNNPRRVQKSQFDCRREDSRDLSLPEVKFKIRSPKQQFKVGRSLVLRSTFRSSL